MYICVYYIYIHIYIYMYPIYLYIPLHPCFLRCNLFKGHLPRITEVAALNFGCHDMGGNRVTKHPL